MLCLFQLTLHGASYLILPYNGLHVTQLLCTMTQHQNNASHVWQDEPPVTKNTARVRHATNAALRLQDSTIPAEVKHRAGPGLLLSTQQVQSVGCSISCVTCCPSCAASFCPMTPDNPFPSTAHHQRLSKAVALMTASGKRYCFLRGASQLHLYRQCCNDAVREGIVGDSPSHGAGRPVAA